MAEIRESFLLKIDTPDPARVWSGVGPLVIPADAVESAPAEYKGAGELLGVPDFQQLINGVAERVEFVVSGVSDETVRLALADAPTVKFAMVYIGLVTFDANWQVISVEWEALYRADVLAVESQSQSGRRERTIRLSVGSEGTGRSYSPAAFFTDTDQRQRSATDSIFTHVASISRGVSRVFGPRVKP